MSRVRILLTNAFRFTPAYLVLLPAFFLIKNGTVYYPVITARILIELQFVYCILAIFLLLLLYLINSKHLYKASLKTFVLLTFYFYYHEIDLYIQKISWIAPFNRYRWSLPILMILLITFFYFIEKIKRHPERTYRFLNTLLFVFCLSAIIPWSLTSLRNHIPVLAVDHSVRFLQNRPAPGYHPNIYFILFDEYQGNRGLKEYFHFDNSTIQNHLSSQGFFMPKLARSNYNYTFFSMPSILNMDSLQGEVQGLNSSSDMVKLQYGMKLMNNSNVIRYFKEAGYSIINLSPFTIDNLEGGIRDFNPIVGPKEIITNQTFPYVIKEKLGSWIENDRILKVINPQDYGNQFYNELVGRAIIKESENPFGSGKFVYAHFFMPHSPYLKDSLGKSINLKEYITANNKNDPAEMGLYYLSYLKYANTVMRDIVDSLIANDPSSIILIMSDHGYRGDKMINKELLFDIQFYLRTPKHVYIDLPDSLEAVNTFRIILNNEFGQQLAYLPYFRKEFKQYPNTHAEAQLSNIR